MFNDDTFLADAWWFTMYWRRVKLHNRRRETLFCLMPLPSAHDDFRCTKDEQSCTTGGEKQSDDESLSVSVSSVHGELERTEGEYSCTKGGERQKWL